MKHMLRAATFALSAMAILAIGAASAQASPDVAVGDILHFTAGPGHSLTGGGEFKVQVVAPVAGVADQFRTFCVQKFETIDFVNDFEVVGINTVSILGFQPLAFQTAYLYSQFRAGTLANYDYANAANRALDAAQLQEAIWGFQNQIALNPGNKFVIQANAAGWTSVGNVRIANLVYTDGDKHEAQDVLVLVPEPASILAWSLIGGCFLVGHRIRRNRLTA